jgi:hypothetical protein
MVMSYIGKKNIYMCPKCGRGFITLDVDKGTTPFLTGCLTEGCTGLARSFCYHAPQMLLDDLAPALEWYQPEESEFAALSAATQVHVKNGGLISRRRGARAKDA